MPTPNMSGWRIEVKQAYYSLQYITQTKLEPFPWWGEEAEPRELAAWILQAEGSIILGDGQRYMAEAIRYRMDVSSCGANCDSYIAWLSGFTPFILFHESDIPALEAGTPPEQVVCRSCLNRLLTEPEEPYKRLIYPLFTETPTYNLLGSPPGIYWWSKADSFTAPSDEYEKDAESSCLYRIRYPLATGSYQWFGTFEQFSYAIRGGNSPSACQI